jgi:exopolyphosphatase / guanosine-5'-triphosphate,3'-diphosphate pyrophosphatase
MDTASIDIGTNAVLLLLMNKNDGGLVEVLDKSTITRLGEGLLQRRHLSRQAMERTARVLVEYRDIIDSHSAKVVGCFGTSALREAENRDEFIDMARAWAGFDVRVFSEYEEAYYTYLSVKLDRSIRGQGLVIIDIGGGSTEVTRGTGERFIDYVSLPIGTVKLTELFIEHDPPLKEELDRLTGFVRDKMPRGLGNGDPTVVGMAGTVTTLAAMILELNEFDKGMIHGLPVSVSTLDHWVERLSAMTLAERRTIPGMEPGREDVLLQGIILMREILEALKASQFVVSTYGARYGVIYESER